MDRRMDGWVDGWLGGDMGERMDTGRWGGRDRGCGIDG